MDRHTSLIISEEQGRWPRYLNPQILERCLAFSKMCLSAYSCCNPSSTEFARRHRTRVHVRVRVYASVLIAKGRGEKKKKKREERRESRKWVKRERRDERWRRVQTVLPESWWLISTLFTLARRQTVGGRRNNSWTHNGVQGNCIHARCPEIPFPRKCCEN